MLNTQIQWNDYEELVKDIYQALGKAHGVRIECWGADCRRTGVSGATYQIDVLAAHSDGVHQYLTAIECKYWNRKVGRDVISKHTQLVQDVQADKGIVVSKMGFSSQAKMVAAANNIGLVVLRKPLDEDWDGKIKEIHIRMVMDQTEIYDISFDILQRADEIGSIPEGPIHWMLQLNQVIIEIPSQEAETLQQLIDKERSQNPTWTEFEMQFPDASILMVPDYPNYPLHGQRIGGVSFKVRHHPPMEENIVLRAEDHVYMIMESIFDGRRYTISPDGTIVENLPFDDDPQE